MRALSAIVLISLSLVAASDDGATLQGRHLKRNAKVKFAGFLTHDQWLAAKERLTRFALVEDSGDLSAPPTRWNVTIKGWRDGKKDLARFKATFRPGTYTQGRLKIDPTKYVALCFRDGDCYLLQVADIKPGHPGVIIFADGFVKATEDLRLLFEQAYDLKEFTTYE